MLGIAKTEPVRGGVKLIRDLKVPEPREGEVRMKVGAAGICGTDVHIYDWVSWSLQRMKLPVVLGHEVSGVVDAVGSGVSYPHIGDFVSLESHIFCGSCYQCRTGRAHLCANMRYPGIDIDGGFAEYLVVPARIAWVHPVGIGADVASMFEPFGIAVHASLEGSGVSGLNVLVTGCGPIGLMAVMGARALGAAKIIASDINPKRLAAAARAGADRAVRVPEEDPVKIVREMTGGRGVDVAMEFSGAPAALAQAVEALCAGGDLRLVGAFSAPVEVNFTPWIMKGLKVQNIHGRKIFHSWEHAGRLVYEKKVDLRPLISHRLPLSEGLQSFELIQRGEAVKVIILPNS